MSEALFGMDAMSMTILIAVVLAVVLVIGLVLWALRRRGRSAFMRGGSNRQPRLAVLDAAVVDDRRRLVLVRRDHVEHLVMIGGPSDIVVERGINRAAARPVQDPMSQQAQVAAAQPGAQPRQSQRMEQPQPPRQQPTTAEPPVTQGPAPVIVPVGETAQTVAKAKDKEPAVSNPKEEDPLPKIAVTVPMPEPVKAAEREETAAEIPQTQKQPDPAPAVAAAAVSTALASAADQMAKLEADSDPEEVLVPDALVEEPDPTPKLEPEEPALAVEANEPAPVVDVNEPVVVVEVDEPGPTIEVDEPAPTVAEDEPAPLVEADKSVPTVKLEEAALEPVNSPAGESVAAVELENIFDATNELEPTGPRAEAAPLEDIPLPSGPLPPANGNVADDDTPAETVTAELDGSETEEAVDQSVMSAEEMIADFDQLLEAEISKAKEQRPDVPTPGTDAENVSSLQKQSLEDEMKKLLGDLSVKQ